MRKLKTVTIWSVLAFIVLSQYTRITYYKHLFGNDLPFGNNLHSVLNISGGVLVILLDILTLVLGAKAVATADKTAQDRSYSLFRFVYVMRGLIDVPLLIIQMFVFAQYWFASPVIALSVLIPKAIWLTLVILLIVCKPENPVQKVDLQDYDMVAFTSAGHRFVHYLIDVLFLLPLWVYVLQFMMINRYGNEVHNVAFRLIFGTSYLLYCFLSEVIFKQTLGKMVTRSCVVSDGVELSAGRIFRRTMARLIPFDAISFLFGSKWHDRASATAVVYVDSWEKAFDEKQEEPGV